MIRSRLIATLLLATSATAVQAQRAPVAPVAATAEVKAPVTILISIDGFRADYRTRGVTPRLDALANGGISAAMRPSFPSKTFPNHWTLVTGMVPDHHGVVGNKMMDAAKPGVTFTMETDDPFWWNTTTPVWVDAEKAGIRTATELWPGSNVAIGGVIEKGKHDDQPTGGTRPEDWTQFNIALSGMQRVNTVLDWLRRPADIRPRFITLYFDEVDTAGHDFGPDDDRTTAVVAHVDTMIGSLVDGLAALGQPANLVVVADHGMASTSSDRVIALDKIADPKLYTVLETGTYASLFPVPGKERKLEKTLLGQHDHATCWKKSDIPARFRYGTNPRIPPYFCLADPEWLVMKTTPTKAETGGNHGYDNQAPQMRALFIANGPAIKPLGALESFDNVDIAPLVRDLIGLPPKPGDGDDAPFRAALGK